MSFVEKSNAQLSASASTWESEATERAATTGLALANAVAARAAAEQNVAACERAYFDAAGALTSAKNLLEAREQFLQQCRRENHSASAVDAGFARAPAPATPWQDHFPLKANPRAHLPAAGGAYDQEREAARVSGQPGALQDAHNAATPGYDPQTQRLLAITRAQIQRRAELNEPEITTEPAEQAAKEEQK